MKSAGSTLFRCFFYLSILFVDLSLMSCSDSKDPVGSENMDETSSLLPAPETIDTSDLSDLPEDTGGSHIPQLAKDTDAAYSHFIYLPSGYSGDGPNYPLMLFLHGGGETSDKVENDLTKLNKVLTHGPPRLIQENKWNPIYPFIVASPQLVDGPWDATTVHHFIAYLIKTYQINESRIYITGLSRGGAGTWSYVDFMGYENYAAAIVPICGYGNTSGAARFNNMPVWAFHGSDDEVISATKNGGSIEMVDIINLFSPKYKAKVTVYSGVGHDSWSRTYDGSAIGTTSYTSDPFDISIYEWMLRFRKE